MTEKKIPQRKCLGCNQMKDKSELVRVVKSSEGAVSVDLTGKKPGRGAYICRSEKCLNDAFKSRRLERSFKCHLPAEIFEQLKNELSAGKNSEV